MSYWDTSALVKLYVQEPDSKYFRGLVSAQRLGTSDLVATDARLRAVTNLVGLTTIP